MDCINGYVITGGPGAGKTAVIEFLKQTGYGCVDEVAREIIRQEIEQGGEALPWRNRELYTSRMLEESVNSYRKWNDHKEILFFDRGIPDTLAYARLINLPDPSAIFKMSSEYRYNPKVFLFPPWQEIYCKDNERKQSFEEAVLTYEVIRYTYQELMYQIIEVPQLPVKVRGEFIFNQIQMEYPKR